MDISAKNIMANEVGQSTLTQLLQFVKDSLPMIGGIIAVWKTIDEIAKWYSKKQEAQLNSLIDAKIVPLQDSIDRLTKMIGVLEQKIKP